MLEIFFFKKVCAIIQIKVDVEEGIMGIYKKGFIVSALLTSVSIGIAIYLNYVKEEQFWCNVCLGVFGSSFLTVITSILGYFVERKRLTEGFFGETAKILNEINKYEINLSLDEKIDFWLKMSDYDVTSWDMYYGQLDFFEEEISKNIYDSIYTPIQNVKHKALYRAGYFRKYKNGTDRSEKAMQMFVDEIENSILEKTEYKCVVDEQEVVGINARNKIYEDIWKELNGRYSKMMHGSKKKVAEENQ